MNFLEPLGLAGLAALIPVIALYFLKLKREERVVPSTLLWKKVIEDLQVNAPFQRLKYSLLLLMQLVLVALLGFSLARPYLSMPGYEGKRIVLLIDTSASMGTTDAGKSGTQTRLSAAIEDAKRRIDELQPGDEMALVAFDRDVRQLSKFSNDRSELNRLVAALEPRDVETRADPAFETALDLIAGKPNAEVLVLSDGCFDNVKLFNESDRQVTGNLEDQAAKDVDADKMQVLRRRLNSFRFVSYGQEISDNAGITQIDARSRPIKSTDDNGQPHRRRRNADFRHGRKFFAETARRAAGTFDGHAEFFAEADYACRAGPSAKNRSTAVATKNYQPMPRGRSKSSSCPRAPAAS